MRIEFSIPDDTDADLVARIVDLTQRLGDKPSLVNQVEIDRDFMSNRAFLAEIDLALGEVKAGHVFTESQVDELLSRTSEEWQEKRAS